MEEEQIVAAQAVRRELDASLLAGRSPVEAVGELRWSTRAAQNPGPHSRQSLDEILRVGDDWLRENVAAADVERYAALAEAYARFLAQQVRPNRPSALHVLDQARRKWREREVR